MRKRNSNLRLVRLARGDCGEHKRASLVRKTWLRPEHPDIAGDLGNPGQLLLLTKWSVTIQPLKTCAL